MWKKKSIFWELEYWKALEVRSAIDVMHLIKNLCVNILGFLGVYGKSKDTTEAQQLYLLAKLPSSNICTFQGYEINGNTFYTIDQDKKSTNQNSGVRFDAKDENGKTTTYYGYIDEIWELDYGPTFKVPLFRCKWVKLNGVQVDDKYGMTIVDLNNLAYMDE
ncbi:hypothetical protein QYE76_005931 [Lolium multiflorum]|uniref:DUF4216 domain-containing protein n=1 Tax=Lolium multiflorum TaxID=4521 RepID=A0AAD8RXC5_LOLMU|nr:hypothetical protein QYE76_005931 [Lolium multiflorum]